MRLASAAAAAADKEVVLFLCMARGVCERLEKRSINRLYCESVGCEPTTYLPSFSDSNAELGKIKPQLTSVPARVRPILCTRWLKFEIASTAIA